MSDKNEFNKVGGFCDTPKSAEAIKNDHNITGNVPIPTVFEEGPLGERGYDLFSRLLRERIIWLGGQVNAAQAQVIASAILFLSSQDKNKPIKLYLNSPGGSVLDGLAILDAMLHAECSVETVGLGLQASMGSFLLSAGTGKRLITANSTHMMHQPSAGAQGTETDMRISMERTTRFKERLTKLYAAFMGIDYDQNKTLLRKSMERDTWTNALITQKLGLADGVIYSSGGVDYGAASPEDVAERAKVRKAAMIDTIRKCNEDELNNFMATVDEDEPENYPALRKLLQAKGVPISKGPQNTPS